MTDPRRQPPLEFWASNPSLYVRQCIAARQFDLVIPAQLAIARKINPYRFGTAYLGTEYDWRVMIVGNAGCPLFDKDHTFDNPKAVFPNWTFGDPWEILQQIVDSPVGEDAAMIAKAHDDNLPTRYIPVAGQEHRVVVSIPSGGLSGNQWVEDYLGDLADIQDRNPQCKIHLSGAGSEVAVSLGLRAFALRVSDYVSLGKYILPNLLRVNSYTKDIDAVKKWLALLDTDIVAMQNDEHRCIKSIHALQWAAANAGMEPDFRTIRSSSVEDQYTPLASGKLHQGNIRTAAPGDMMLCDSCSFITSCTAHRKGALCSVPGSEPSEFVKMFRSRNPDRILDALSDVVAMQADRTERAMAVESEKGLSKETSGMINDLFRNGTALAKLIDPGRFKPATKVLNVSGNVNLEAGDNRGSRQIVADAIKELEDAGVGRSDITPGMMRAVLEGDVGETRRQIEGTVISSTDY